MNKDKKDLKEYIGIALFIPFTTIIFFGVFESVLNLNVKDWVNIIISVISASCTLILGAVSYWQNKTQRREFERQRKIDAEVKYMESYKQRLFSINDKMINYDIVAELHNIAIKVNTLEINKFSNSEIKDLWFDLDQKLSSIVLFLNHIENTIIHNKYYIDSLDTLAINIVKIREKIDQLKFEYLSYTKFFVQDFCPEDLSFVSFTEDTITIMTECITLQASWLDYLDNISEFFESLEQSGNLEKIQETFKYNSKEIQLLRKKLIDKK